MPNALHWGIFVGDGITSYGTLFDYVQILGEGTYRFNMKVGHQPKRANSKVYFDAHRVGEIPENELSRLETMLSGLTVRPGTTCQLWVVTALNYLIGKYLGWIDISRKDTLESHLPSRFGPGRSPISLRRTACDVTQLDDAPCSYTIRVPAGESLDLWLAT